MKQIILFIGIISLSSIAVAQSDHQNSSSNADQTTMSSNIGAAPANPFKGFTSPWRHSVALNIDNYYSPKIQGTTEVGNVLLLRGVLVTRRHMIRGTMPVVSLATPNGYKSGLGNFNIFDAIRLTGDSAKVHFGLGPFMSIPSSTSRALGVDYWQFGAAALIAHADKSGVVVGGLATYRTGVFEKGAEQSNGGYLTVQPALIIHIEKGLYARSAGATCIFDFNNNKTLIPIGLGLGSFFKAGNAMGNIFIEPAFTVYSEGENLPALQVLMGLYFIWMRHKKI